MMNIAIPYASHPFFAIATWLQEKLAVQAKPTQTQADPRLEPLYFAANQIREVVRPLGVTVHCVEGSVWITTDGDNRDVVLGAGHSLNLARDQRTLIMALESSHVRCVDAVAT